MLEAAREVAAHNRQIDVLRIRQDIFAQPMVHAEPELAIEVNQARYGIAREALWNAVKHARARHATSAWRCMKTRWIHK